MVFITLVILAICLYIWNYKISALVIFFFFLTSGFDMVPEEIMTNALFSKGMDYAIFIIVGIIIVDSVCIKNYWKPDKLLWVIIIFYIFLALCVIYNRYVIGVGWKDIIRTIRYNVLWAAYLIFRKLPKERLLELLKYLFLITVFCSILFILQIFLNEHILNETSKSSIEMFGMKLPRFYNQPDMLLFFTFMAVYFNPYNGIFKITTTAILVMALLGAFHRGLLIAFIAAISIAYIIRLPRLRRIVVLTSVSILSLFFIIFYGYKFANSRTIIDISTVLSGNVTSLEAGDIDIEDLQNSTFTFRIFHLLERNLYILDHPKAMLFGAGLMSEDSKLTDSMFNFDIGVIEEALDRTAQIDTADISYSILLLRYGYLGTLLVLSLYIFFMVYFYKNHKNPIGLFSFAYFIVAMIVSFSSSVLVMPVTFLLPLITYNIVKKNKDENKFTKEFSS